MENYDSFLFPVVFVISFDFLVLTRELVDTCSRRLATVNDATGPSRPQHNPSGDVGHRVGADHRAHSHAPQPTHYGPYTLCSVSSHPNRQPEYPQHVSQQREMDLVHSEQDEFEFLQANKKQLL